MKHLMVHILMDYTLFLCVDIIFVCCLLLDHEMLVLYISCRIIVSAVLFSFLFVFLLLSDHETAVLYFKKNQYF